MFNVNGDKCLGDSCTCSGHWRHILSQLYHRPNYLKPMMPFKDINVLSPVLFVSFDVMSQRWLNTLVDACFQSHKDTSDTGKT